jgi:hypothetical protein
LKLAAGGLVGEAPAGPAQWGAEAAPHWTRSRAHAPLQELQQQGQVGREGGRNLLPGAAARGIPGEEILLVWGLLLKAH